MDQRPSKSGSIWTLMGLSFQWQTCVHTLREARERGFRIVLHARVLPSTAYAVKRVAIRVRTGGHHMPEEDAARRFHHSREHFLADCIPLADEWWAWDHAEPPPTLLARSGTCPVEDLERLLLGNRLMENQPLSHDEHNRATEEMMNYFMRMEIELPEEMVSPEWKKKFADFKRKMAAA